VEKRGPNLAGTLLEDCVVRTGLTPIAPMPVPAEGEKTKFGFGRWYGHNLFFHGISHREECFSPVPLCYVNIRS
jgi:hypothetical protein